MAENQAFKWRLLFVSILLLFSLSSSQPYYPCLPPHSSFPFCNTSLPISIRATSLISLLSLSEKIQQLSNSAAAVPRLGLPPYQWWSESLHGVAINGPGVLFNGSIRTATGFPQVLLSAAAFNRTLWRAIAEAIAVEARAMYNLRQAGLTFWAPNINVFRDPRWGRGQETPGEDPLVVSTYAVDYVRGFQGDVDGGSMMLSACCKHYTAYDLEKWHKFSRYTFNAKVTKQDMEDTYQLPFRSCIEDGKASCLMCSYNQVNGIPACARGDLLAKARGEWGFKGYITSDCDAVAIIYEDQHYAPSHEDAVADVLKAGMDINCGTYLLRHAKSAVKKGKLKKKYIDRALFNLFSVQLRLGLFDGDPKKQRFGRYGTHDVCTKEHRKLALEGARQGIVLLKNDKNFLPLQKSKVKSLAIIGPAADDTDILGGDYTGFSCNPKSLYKGLQAYVERTTFAAGCLDVPCNSTIGFEEAVHVAPEADVVVVVVGLNLTEETEDHDRTSLLLPGKQMHLIKAIARVSKNPLTLLLMGGGPLDVSFAKRDPKIASVLWIGYPGETGGQAVAEALFGDFNPGGRLPVTWYPESFTHVPMNDMNMRTDPSRGYPGRTYRFYTGEVVYPFGYGLSYSKYSYKIKSAPHRISLLESTVRRIATEDGLNYVHIDKISSCEALKFSVKVSVVNSGPMDGDHSVILFSRSLANITGLPRKQLIGFERVHTIANRDAEIDIHIDTCKHLSIANEQGERVLPLGVHVLELEELEHVLFVEA